MGLKIVRFLKDQQERWGVEKEGQIYLLPRSYGSLADFLKEGKEEARKLLEQSEADVVSFNDVTILSPVTKPARIVCQGVNYATHRAETGLEASRPPFNLIFSKADSALSGAYDNIVRPNHVKLLDYEVELGMVIGTEITKTESVTDDNLYQFIAGILIVNDVSARDVQLTQGQWLKGKSYRTFCPTGPYLYLLDKDELPSIHNLELSLWVNDELRQSANSNQMLYKPAETLSELSSIMDLSPGDLVVTGTGGGVAMNLTPEMNELLSNRSVPYQEKLEKLVEKQLGNGKYLKDGDVIRSRITSADGTIDLGEQINNVSGQR